MRCRALPTAILAITLAAAACAAGPTRILDTQEYAIATSAMAAPGKPFVVCHAVPESLPPPGCDGAELSNFDPSSYTTFAVHAYTNGVRETPVLRFVGTWDGHRLKLIRAPAPATPSPPPSLRCPGTKSVPNRITEALRRDESSLQASGIQLLEYGPCDDTASVLLVVADARAANTLRTRYGEMYINGWLQPVR